MQISSMLGVLVKEQLSSSIFYPTAIVDTFQQFLPLNPLN
ncbi:hypothetical protein M595_3945 [Lyngbya aestuarii BL J]|uniref:Uncharacterized protein n=1 Tax=Lyngbya aestuarii BL J TaxID=1348334 RepID=U7QDY2_9CYAN|nr:hypothetical protein M595_3945 [Lyngbya aestuarii BL J]